MFVSFLYCGSQFFIIEYQNNNVNSVFEEVVIYLYISVDVMQQWKRKTEKNKQQIKKAKSTTASKETLQRKVYLINEENDFFRNRKIKK